jgi:tetratricopeptide (TPR) repeat protein
MLMVWSEVTQKQLGAALEIKQSPLSQHLTRGEIKDDLFARILQALRCRPVVVLILTACLETLDALVQAADLTEDELLVIERAAQNAARHTREGLIEIARLSRRTVSAGYPGPLDLAPLRRRAEELWARLKDRPVDFWTSAVEALREYRSWSFCEKVCEMSVREASRNLKRATALAELAVQVAERVQGPSWWCDRVRGYALAHLANALRVAGHLQEADALLERAKGLWEAGDDPDEVLDPGRLPNLQGALRRDQRRFDDALACHDDAFSVGHSPELALIQKGFTLEVMGDYERAIQILGRAVPMVEFRSDPRLWNILRLNLANVFCHQGRYTEAAGLVNAVRPVAAELGDEIDLNRATWLEGRVLAGSGRIAEALILLEAARQKFAAEKMSYDISLALLEEAVLLLEQGRTAEVRVLTEGLNEVFRSKGVHREALAALRLFKEAAEREVATAEMARRVLRYLYRARHDQGLRFSGS